MLHVSTTNKEVNPVPGEYIVSTPPPKYGLLVGWKKNMVILKEKRIYNGDQVENRGKRGKFHCTFK